MINCRLNLEYPSKDHAIRFLDKLQTRLGRDFLNRRTERYWKIDGQFQSTFQIANCDGSKEEIVYDFLRLTQIIENKSWAVHGPQEMETVFIEAILDNGADDQPLKWVHLDTETPNK